MSEEGVHRITIQTDSKRWWPKTIYHTYWSRLFYSMQRNSVCWLISLLILISFAFASFRSVTPNMTELKMKALKEKLINDPYLFTSPHQEKLASPHPPADTYLDWNLVNKLTNTTHPVKAAFVVVVQENDMHKLRATMQDVETRFNHRYQYPWIILGDRLFSNTFRHWMRNTSKSPIFFGQIPAIEWYEPHWVDVKKMEQNIQNMVRSHKIDKGESVSWRRMTRYTTGFIAHHPLLKGLEYYWKVQPGSQYTCDILDDPFMTMKEFGQKLSFELTLTENHENLDEFHETVQTFISTHKNMLQPVSNSMWKGLLNTASLQQDIDKNSPIGEHTGHLSNCMIYNNFAIYSLDFLRSKEYTTYFDYLDQTGGFFYHKWGDSMPQSIAAGLFLKRSEIGFGNILGYDYGAGSTCPNNLEQYSKLKCTCRPSDYKIRVMKICSVPIMKAILGMQP